MKGAQRVLHIRCGDDIRDKLVEAGVEGGQGPLQNGNGGVEY